MQQISECPRRSPKITSATTVCSLAVLAFSRRRMRVVVLVVVVLLLLRLRFVFGCLRNFFLLSLRTRLVSVVAALLILVIFLALVFLLRDSGDGLARLPLPLGIHDGRLLHEHGGHVLLRRS